LLQQQELFMKEVMLLTSRLNLYILSLQVFSCYHSGEGLCSGSCLGFLSNCLSNSFIGWKWNACLAQQAWNIAPFGKADAEGAATFFVLQFHFISGRFNSAPAQNRTVLFITNPSINCSDAQYQLSALAVICLQIIYRPSAGHSSLGSDFSACTFPSQGCRSSSALGCAQIRKVRHGQADFMD